MYTACATLQGVELYREDSNGTAAVWYTKQGYEYCLIAHSRHADRALTYSSASAGDDDDRTTIPDNDEYNARAMEYLPDHVQHNQEIYRTVSSLEYSTRDNEYAISQDESPYDGLPFLSSLDGFTDEDAEEARVRSLYRDEETLDFDPKTGLRVISKTTFGTYGYAHNTQLEEITRFAHLKYHRIDAKFRLLARWMLTKLPVVYPENCKLLTTEN